MNTGRKSSLLHQPSNGPLLVNMLEMSASQLNLLNKCPVMVGAVPCKHFAGHTTEHEPAHTCHWPGCGKTVPPAMWGCKKHWMLLPIDLRRRIWRTYIPGQEITKTPSPAYLKAANDVQEWIRTHGAVKSS